MFFFYIRRIRRSIFDITCFFLACLGGKAGKAGKSDRSPERRYEEAGLEGCQIWLFLFTCSMAARARISKLRVWV